MANPEHVEIVKQGAEANRQWREANPHRALELTVADLSGADLAGVNLHGEDLSRANLSGAFLRNAFLRCCLSHANLQGADLVGADLSRAALGDADLRNARLESADLSHSSLFRANATDACLVSANICAANLAGARLSGADLGHAILIGADLRATDLSRAVLRYTVLADVDLSTVIGLETAEHQARSTVGIDTLYRSSGKIPEVFLRGCGVPDEFITYTSSFAGNVLEFYTCFISYSHDDKSFALRLHDQLQRRGIRCWLDEHAMLPGENIYAAVDRGIRVYDKVLLCCSKSSLSSWWVNDEVTKTLAKERELSQARGATVEALIPLNLDGYMLDESWTAGWRNQVLDRKAADFTGWEFNNAKFESEFEKVVAALRSDGGGKLPPPASKL